MFAVPGFRRVQGDVPWPCQGVRAATSIRSRRKVAPRPLVYARLANGPAARSRLWAMAAQVSQAALAGNGGHMRERPVGHISEGLLDDGMVAVLLLRLDELERESVKTAWQRKTGNSSSWPRACTSAWPPRLSPNGSPRTPPPGQRRGSGQTSGHTCCA
jgi:hypothetical protein